MIQYTWQFPSLNVVFDEDATLTAAIQEQQAMITQLKARLDAANL